MKVDYIKNDENNENEDKKEKIERRSPRRILIDSKGKTLGATSSDILVVASKLKKYVKEEHGLNTSGNVMDVLSNILRVKCDEAADRAKREGRKTLLDRDF